MMCVCLSWYFSFTVLHTYINAFSVLLSVCLTNSPLLSLCLSVLVSYYLMSYCLSLSKCVRYVGGCVMFDCCSVREGPP